MTDKNLDYLSELHKESINRILTDAEIKEVQKILKLDIEQNEITDNTVLKKVSDININQSNKPNVERLHRLTDDVIKYGELLGEKYVVEKAKSVEVMIAAKYIDDEQYDNFQFMIDSGFDPHLEPWNGRNLMDNVKTLKGIEYLDKNGLIPAEYFTEARVELPLCRAYPEQIDFYIKHGADVNAKDRFGQTVLDHMVYCSYPAESIDKICKAGGKSYENPLGLLVERVTYNYDEQLQKYGEKSIERSLENIAVLLKNGYEADYYRRYVPRDKKGEFLYDAEYDIKNVNRRFFDKIRGNKQLAEKYPELIDEIMSFDKKDSLQEKMNTLHEKLGNNVGKTADVKTGKTTDEHRKIAETQVGISKAMMKTKLERQGKL